MVLINSERGVTLVVEENNISVTLYRTEPVCRGTRDTGACARGAHYGVTLESTPALVLSHEPRAFSKSVTSEYILQVRSQ